MQIQWVYSWWHRTGVFVQCKCWCINLLFGDDLITLHFESIFKLTKQTSSHSAAQGHCLVFLCIFNSAAHILLCLCGERLIHTTCFWFQITTRGCETSEMTLRRNSLGQLGFHVNFEGIVADVEPFGFAWKAGLRQGSRLVEICKVVVATLTHEQMIDLLRTSVSVKVVVIQPHEDGTPRR